MTDDELTRREAVHETHKRYHDGWNRLLRLRLCDEAALALIRESERADADAREQMHLHHGDRP